MICPGRTYRCDTDQTHTPMFHQVEGLVIDKSAQLGHLKWILEEFCKAFFEVPQSGCASGRASSRSPSRRSRSTSSAGAGRRDPLRRRRGLAGDPRLRHGASQRAAQLRPRSRRVYQGFAWGMGIDRIAMLKYGMPDLRAFFEADVRWLVALRLQAARHPDAGGRIERVRRCRRSCDGTGIDSSFIPRMAENRRMSTSAERSRKRKSGSAISLSW